MLTTMTDNRQLQFTDAQSKVLTDCKAELGDRYLSAHANPAHELVLDYQTLGGYYVRAIYDGGGRLLIKHYYSGYNYELNQPVILLYSRNY